MNILKYGLVICLALGTNAAFAGTDSHSHLHKGNKAAAHQTAQMGIPYAPWWDNPGADHEQKSKKKHSN